MTCLGEPSGVEAPISDHLRDSLLDLEGYKAVRKFPVHEDGNQEDKIFFGNFYH